MASLHQGQADVNKALEQHTRKLDSLSTRIDVLTPVRLGMSTEHTSIITALCTEVVGRELEAFGQEVREFIHGQLQNSTTPHSSEIPAHIKASLLQIQDMKTDLALLFQNLTQSYDTIANVLEQIKTATVAQPRTLTSGTCVSQPEKEVSNFHENMNKCRASYSNNSGDTVAQVVVGEISQNHQTVPKFPDQPEPRYIQDTNYQAALSYLDSRPVTNSATEHARRNLQDEINRLKLLPQPEVFHKDDYSRALIAADRARTNVDRTTDEESYISASKSGTDMGCEDESCLYFSADEKSEFPQSLESASLDISKILKGHDFSDPANPSQVTNISEKRNSDLSSPPYTTGRRNFMNNDGYSSNSFSQVSLLVPSERTTGFSSGPLNASTGLSKAHEYEVEKVDIPSLHLQYTEGMQSPTKPEKLWSPRRFFGRQRSSEIRQALSPDKKLEGSLHQNYEDIGDSGEKDVDEQQREETHRATVNRKKRQWRQKRNKNENSLGNDIIKEEREEVKEALEDSNQFNALRGVEKVAKGKHVILGSQEIWSHY